MSIGCSILGQYPAAQPASRMVLCMVIVFFRANPLQTRDRHPKNQRAGAKRRRMHSSAADRAFGWAGADIVSGPRLAGVPDSGG
jgi:hypothetical protein